MKMTPALFDMVAERFKALGEPARLQILHALRRREMTVTELIDATGLGQANISRHLGVLYSLAFVTRRKEGLYVYYALADQDVFALCDLMCGRIEREVKTKKKMVIG